MSQLPEMPAADWPEQGYDPSAYPQPDEGQQYPHPQPEAAPWQQDTQPDWVQQQGYADQQSYVDAQGFAGEAAGASNSGLPTEFDHLFRDSTPDSRRAIDRQKPAVGGASPGYLGGGAPQQQPQPEAAQLPEQAVPGQQGAPYQDYQQAPFPQSAEQYGSGQYQGAPYDGTQFQGSQYQGAQYQGAQYAGFENGQYQGQQFQPGQYTPAEYPQAGPGYGGGPFDGGGSDGGRGGAPRNRRVLIIGGAVAVAAVIGIVIALQGGSPGRPSASGSSPSASSSAKTMPKQQADAVYDLIKQSETLRSDANTGVVDVNGCKDLADAQTLLASTAQKRQSQADSVAKLDVSGIQNGAQLVAQLKAAWSASAQYDNAYAQIAGDMQGNCKTSAVKKDSNYKSANQAAGSADDAKSQAAQLWNDNVAASLGESQVTSGKL